MRNLSLYIVLLFMLLCGCSTTYVPISWNYGDKVKKLSTSDNTLKVLYSRYDPQRQTLRVRAASFEEVMMPYEVKYHLGAYRADTRILYRNLYHEYDDKELREVMLHEFAHHIWFAYMSQDQRDKWKEHLALNPSPLQAKVREIYSRPSDWDAEDFAFVVSHARRVDIEQLATLNLLTEAERDAVLKDLPSEKPIQPVKSVTAKAGPGTPSGAESAKAGAVVAAGPDAAKASSVVSSGSEPAKPDSAATATSERKPGSAEAAEEPAKMGAAATSTSDPKAGPAVAAEVPAKTGSATTSASEAKAGSDAAAGDPAKTGPATTAIPNAAKAGPDVPAALPADAGSATTSTSDAKAGPAVAAVAAKTGSATTSASDAKAGSDAAAGDQPKADPATTATSEPAKAGSAAAAEDQAQTGSAVAAGSEPAQVATPAVIDKGHDEAR